MDEDYGAQGYDWGAQDYDWGGAQYGSADPLNLSYDDPASAYYTGPGSGYNQSGAQGYSGAEQYMAPGTGMYDVGGGWQPVSSPGGGGYGGYSLGGGGSPSTGAVSRNSSTPWSAPMGGGGGGFGGGGGSRGGFQQQPYQRMSLGVPERTLYDRYSKLLQNPEGMAEDPAYKFLFNQGMQAFNRTAAAKGMRLSGNTLLGAQEYGQGRAFDYTNRMLPQYRAGAQEELSRFMGPAGLLPSYTGANNQITSREGSDAAAQDLLPYYQRMLEGGMGGGSYPGAFQTQGAGYGGNQNYTRRLGGDSGSAYDNYSLSDLMDERGF